jgi:hypothetical protein
MRSADGTRNRWEPPLIRKLLTVASAIALGLAAGACSSSSKPQSGAGTLPSLTVPVATNPLVATTTTVVEVGAATYARLIAPLNTALQAVSAAPSNANMPTAVLTKAEAAISTFESAALHEHWKGATTPADIRALALALGKLGGDLTTVNAQTALTAAAYRTRLAQDLASTHTAANLVRADLGLRAPA